jgi:adenylate kinase
VPDELVLDMLFDRVARPDCAEGYLLDGFPRTLPQAEALEKRLGKSVNVQAINLAVADEALVERMTGRRTCEKCGNIHHVENAPPRVAGVCDKCGGKLVQRSDDAALTVQKRLAVYHDQTAPLEQFYSARGVLDEVDGSRSPDEVFQALKQVAAGARAS